jgi:hypothetical protein
LLATACITANAQVNIGIKAGINRYVLTGNNQSYKNDLYVGGFVQIQINY